MSDRLFDAREVAQWIGLPRATVYELARAGILPCIRLGRSVRFDREVVARWLAEGGSSLPGGWRRLPRP